MKNVLVVDDSRIMRGIVKNSFLNLKIPAQFLEAANGAEALHILSENPINLVLIDWNMPMVSGLDFLKKVRGMSEYKDLPIIMITSEAAKYNVIEALKAGVTGYLIKPLNEENFKKTILGLKF